CNSSRRTFTATHRSMATWRALETTPMPPSPSRSRISKPGIARAGAGSKVLVIVQEGSLSPVCLAAEPSGAVSVEEDHEDPHHPPALLQLPGHRERRHPGPSLPRPPSGRGWLLGSGGTELPLSTPASHHHGASDARREGVGSAIPSSSDAVGRGWSRSSRPRPAGSRGSRRRGRSAPSEIAEPRGCGSRPQVPGDAPDDLGERSDGPDSLLPTRAATRG